MKQAKRIVSIVCILSLQADLFAHFGNGVVNGSRIGWVKLFALYRAWAATDRYVKTSCTNGISTYNPGADTCTGGSSLVYSSIANGLAAMSGGDTLLIRAGTYPGIDNYVVTIPAGSSWNSPTTIKAYNGETVTLSGNPGNGATVIVQAENLQFVSFEGPGLVVDAANAADEAISINQPITGNTSLTPHHIRFRNVEVKNAWKNCVQVTHHSHDNWYDGNTVHHCGAANAELPEGQTALYHGFYASDTNSTYENNTVHTVTSALGTLNTGYCFQFYPTPSNLVVRNNILHTCTPMTLYGSGHKVSSNIAYNGQGSSDFSIDNASSSSIYNNTLVSAVPIGIYKAGTANTVRNNISVNHTSTDIFNTGGGTVSHNFCTSGCNANGDPLFVNAGANIYALQATSPAINAGTSSIASGVTRAFNGAAPDIGAHETITFNSCSAAGNTLTVSFDNSVNPPMLYPSVTGTTLVVDGTGRTPSSPVVSTNSVSITFSGAAVVSTATYAYATTGSVSDSALIGNSNNQRLNAVSTTSCSVTPPAGAQFAQTHYRFSRLRSSSTSTPETARIWIRAVDTDARAMPGGQFGIRLKVACTGGDCATGAFSLRYAKNGGSYTAVPDTCGADAICFVGTSSTAADIPSNATATTEQLTSDHASDIAGAVIRTSAAIPNIDLAQNSECEMEYLIGFSSSAAVGDVYTFRLYKDGGALNTYTVTPSMTIARPQLRM